MRGGFRRRRPLLRAAVVGGGAYVAGKSAARRQDANAAQEADQDARLGQLEQQQTQEQAAPVPAQRAAEPSAKSPMMEQLDQLAGLHNQGVLTDDEFAAAKAKVLGN
jgi:hypothetical protein